MINNFISKKRLRSSILWFSVITAVLGSVHVHVWYSWREVYGIPMVLAIILSSVFFWWLFIVHPQRASIVRGVLASIMGLISGPILFGMGLSTWIILTRVLQNPIIIFSLLIEGLVVFAVIIPLGYLFFLIGRSLVGYLRRTILSKVTHQSAVVLRLLVVGLLIALPWFIGLRGSILYLIWGVPGGLLAWYLHHAVLPEANINQQTQEPLQQTSQIIH